MIKKIAGYFKQQSLPQKRVLLGCGVALTLVLVIMAFRLSSYLFLSLNTKQDAITVVSTVKAIHGAATESIILPGNVQAWHETTLFARTNGYIKRWLVDIGDYVKKGDLLAEIETPELDEQLQQAQAELQRAEINYRLAKITAERWVALRVTDSVSQQETDEKISAEKAAAMQVAAAKANRDRLKKLVGFERVIAPFDGVITSRTTDLGSLINAGSNTRPALFRIAQADALRIYVRVPQNYAQRIQPQMKVLLYFSSHPRTLFPATLFQTADAIDPKSRTLLAQFTTDNKNHLLLPGSYTEVHFAMPIPPEIVRIPVNTLLFRAQGLQVATIDDEHRVQLKAITINRDLGDTVEVNSGIQAGEDIILNPSDSIYTGQKVHIAKNNKEDATV
jgi:RND family efflux transporter MFP subunit